MNQNEIAALVQSIIAATVPQIVTAVMAEINVAETAKVTLTAPTPTTAKKPNKVTNGEYRAARLDRRSTTVLGGLTSKERKALAAKLPYGYSSDQWIQAVTALKNGSIVL